MLTKLKLIYWRWVKSCCERDMKDINIYLAETPVYTLAVNSQSHRARCQAMREQRQALKDYRNAVNVIKELERQVR